MKRRIRYRFRYGFAETYSVLSARFDVMYRSIFSKTDGFVFDESLPLSNMATPEVDTDDEEFLAHIVDEALDQSAPIGMPMIQAVI